MKNLLEQIDRMRLNIPPVDAGKLKYFAVIIMLIDHTACLFLEVAHTPDGVSLMYTIPGGPLADSILRAIGRQAFPIFCFFLVEGFMKTRSRAKYFLRLVFFALLSQIPFQKGIFPLSVHFHGSVMCTLAIGLLAIWVIDAMRQAFLESGRESGAKTAEAAGAAETADLTGAVNAPGGRGEEAAEQTSPALRMQEAGALSIFSAGLFLLVSCSSLYGFLRLAILLRTDYSYGGVIVIVLMYLFRKYRIPGLFISWAWLSWYNILEVYSAPAFFLLAGYNGQRGKQNKYFFYIFYPAHLLILWLVRRHFFGI